MLQEFGLAVGEGSAAPRAHPHAGGAADPDERGPGEAAGTRDHERTAAKEAAVAAVGDLSDRELFLAGVALYWVEGSKDEPHRRTEVLQFINSDPDVITLFVRWLELLDVHRDRLTVRVSIHESADVQAAERFWADVPGIDATSFRKATLKRHSPRTVRKNTGDGYRGCPLIYVRQSADPYRRTEGAWYGIVGAARPGGSPNRTQGLSRVV